MEPKMVSILIFAAILVAGRLFSTITRKSANKTSFWKSSEDYTAVIVSVVPVIGVTEPILEYYFSYYPLNLVISSLGGLFILSGFIIAFAANKVIQQNWSAVIVKEESQKLVTSGIYRVVRHPLYFSGILIVTGSGLYFQARYSLIAIIICFAVILWRIKKEEELLLEKFDVEYKAYKERTKKIIPFIF